MRRFLAAAAALASVAILVVGCSHDRGPVAGETTIDVDGTPVHAIDRPGERTGPRRPGPVVTVLFLHGQSYTSRIWADRGIVDSVTDTGHRAVAVDLPGFGDTPARDDDTPTERAAFLAALVDELGGPTHVVLVSPSRSGEWSLPYLESSASDGLAGFVPVAPVGIDDFDRPADAPAIATVAVWGSKDATYTATRAKHLVDELGGAPGARTEVIDGASHAAYDDHPDEFTKLLLAALPT